MLLRLARNYIKNNRSCSGRIVETDDYRTFVSQQVVHHSKPDSSTLHINISGTCVLPLLKRFTNYVVNVFVKVSE